MTPAESALAGRLCDLLEIHVTELLAPNFHPSASDRYVGVHIVGRLEFFDPYRAGLELRIQCQSNSGIGGYAVLVNTYYRENSVHNAQRVAFVDFLERLKQGSAPADWVYTYPKSGVSLNKILQAAVAPGLGAFVKPEEKRACLTSISYEAFMEYLNSKAEAALA